MSVEVGECKDDVLSSHLTGPKHNPELTLETHNYRYSVDILHLLSLPQGQHQTENT